MVQENKLNNFRSRDKEQTITHHRVHISTSSTNNRHNTVAINNLHKPKCQTTIYISIETISHLTNNSNMDKINNSNLIKINLANINSNNLNLQGNSKHSTRFKIFLTNSLNNKEVKPTVLTIIINI
jgi:5'-3' exonuclease